MRIKCTSPPFVRYIWYGWNRLNVLCIEAIAIFRGVEWWSGFHASEIFSIAYFLANWAFIIVFIFVFARGSPQWGRDWWDLSTGQALMIFFGWNIFCYLDTICWHGMSCNSMQFNESCWHVLYCCRAFIPRWWIDQASKSRVLGLDLSLPYVSKIYHQSDNRHCQKQKTLVGEMRSGITPFESLLGVLSVSRRGILHVLRLFW